MSSGKISTEQYLERMRQEKSKRGLSFAQIAEKMGRDELYVAAM